MARSYREIMDRKSEDALLDYLNNYNKYTPEAITAAVDELRRRGRNFDEEELNAINLKIQDRTKAENEEDTLFESNSWHQNVVTDPSAPLLYSKDAIRAFSGMFSTIFGAVLLASNINDTKRKLLVIAFGIIYTIVTIALLQLIPANAFYVLIINAAGGLGLISTFWDKYVGKETKYRAKPVWKPLIISIIALIPFLLVIIYGWPFLE
jgi:hypothetical protein